MFVIVLKPSVRIHGYYTFREPVHNVLPCHVDNPQKVISEYRNEHRNRDCHISKDRYVKKVSDKEYMRNLANKKRSLYQKAGYYYQGTLFRDFPPVAFKALKQQKKYDDDNSGLNLHKHLMYDSASMQKNWEKPILIKPGL